MAMHRSVEGQLPSAVVDVDSEDDDVADVENAYRVYAGELAHEQGKEKFFSKTRISCRVCGNPGRVYNDVASLLQHARSTMSLPVLHRGFAKALKEVMEPKMEDSSHEGGVKREDEQVVWPPILLVENVRLAKNDKGEWEGVSNQTLRRLLQAPAQNKIMAVYGKEGHHSGTSIMKFADSKEGYLAAAVVSDKFARSGMGFDGWMRDRQPREGGGFNGKAHGMGAELNLYVYLARPEDMLRLDKRNTLKWKVISYSEAMEAISQKRAKLGEFTPLLAEKKAPTAMPPLTGSPKSVGINTINGESTNGKVPLANACANSGSAPAMTTVCTGWEPDTSDHNDGPDDLNGGLADAGLSRKDRIVSLEDRLKNTWAEDTEKLRLIKDLAEAYENKAYSMDDEEAGRKYLKEMMAELDALKKAAIEQSIKFEEKDREELARLKAEERREELAGAEMCTVALEVRLKREREEREEEEVREKGEREEEEEREKREREEQEEREKREREEEEERERAEKERVRREEEERRREEELKLLKERVKGLQEELGAVEAEIDQKEVEFRQLVEEEDKEHKSKLTLIAKEEEALEAEEAEADEDMAKLMHKILERESEILERAKEAGETLNPAGIEMLVAVLDNTRLVAQATAKYQEVVLTNLGRFHQEEVELRERQLAEQRELGTRSATEKAKLHSRYFNERKHMLKWLEMRIASLGDGTLSQVALPDKEPMGSIQVAAVTDGQPQND